MNFDLTDQQILFADQVRRFAQTHLVAGALKRASGSVMPKLMTMRPARSSPSQRFFCVGLISVSSTT